MIGRSFGAAREANIGLLAIGTCWYRAAVMIRNPQALVGRDFDVVIVGCGIYGAATAREAAQRGLSVALMDRSDFGAATSANSLKIIHGGLRYLQQLDFARTRESVRERRAMMRIAPHLVHPLPCVMPTRGHMMKGPEAMFAGMLLNDLLSFDRNSLHDPQKHIPRGRVVSARTCRTLVPGLPEGACNGGAVWHDGIATNTERLVFGMVRGAVEAGAVAVNYLECRGLSLEGDRVTGVHARDRLTGTDVHVTGRLVVNNAGTWCDEVLARLGRPVQPVTDGLAIGMNLVLNRQVVGSHAVGLRCPGTPGQGSRLLFFVPWRGRTMVGTYYRTYHGSPSDARVRDEEIETFLGDINVAHPAASVSRSDIALVQAGVLPGVPGNTDAAEPRLRRHYRLVDHAARDGIEGLYTILGVKYTTARDVAQRAVEAVVAKLGARPGPSRSAVEPLPGGDIEAFDTFLANARADTASRLDAATAERVARTYGTLYGSVLDAAEEEPDLLKPLAGGTSVLGAEVAHAVRAESAVTLGDVAFRRTELATAGIPEDGALDAAARIMARALGWDGDRIAAEIASVSEAPFPGAERLVPAV